MNSVTSFNDGVYACSCTLNISTFISLSLPLSISLLTPTPVSRYIELPFTPCSDFISAFPRDVTALLSVRAALTSTPRAWHDTGRFHSENRKMSSVHVVDQSLLYVWRRHAESAVWRVSDRCAIKQTRFSPSVSKVTRWCLTKCTCVFCTCTRTIVNQLLRYGRKQKGCSQTADCGLCIVSAASLVRPNFL